MSRDTDTRILIRSVFLHRGHLVLEAANDQHAAAVCILMEGEIDLIIADASLLQRSSWGQWQQRMPRILGLLDPADAPWGTDAIFPGVEYLAKPFTAEEITRKVRSILDSHKQKKKVLIVDDDESLRRILTAILEASGYEGTQASNGKEALSRAETLKADVILTEVVMPEMAGLQMMQEVLQLNPGLKMIAMSGVERAERYLSVAKSLGAKATLTKPLQVEELLQVLREVLQQ